MDTSPGMTTQCSAFFRFANTHRCRAWCWTWWRESPSSRRSSWEWSQPPTAAPLAEHMCTTIGENGTVQTTRCRWRSLRLNAASVATLPTSDNVWACSSALNRIRWRAIFLHRAFQRLYRNRLTLHQPPLVEENLNRSPSRLGPVDGSSGAANTIFCKQLLGYSRVSAAEELWERGCWSFLTKNKTD